MSDTLTPTECLILDVLAARYRLGEFLWTFSTRVAPALRSLAERGLIEVHHGVTYQTLRAELTEAGIAHELSSTYTSPLERKLAAATGSGVSTTDGGK